MRPRNLLALPLVTALAWSFVTVPAHAAGSSYTWIGSSQSSGGDNHSWTDPMNWSPSGVPGAGDSVSIAQPDTSHCTAHVDNVPTVSLANFALAQNPNLCGTSVDGGDITVTGSFSWNGGVLATPTMLAAGATGVISGSNSRLDELAQNLDVAGTLTLFGVTGTGASNSGALRIDNPDVLHVLAGGTLASSGSNDVKFLSCCNNPARIVNDGTLSVSSGDLTVDAVAVDQHGTLSASSGGRLVSVGAPLTTANGASYTGTGGWLIEDGAVARMSGTQTLGSGFHLELGGLAVDAGARLGGTATLAGTGTLDWTGGTIEGNLTIAHGVTLHASGAHAGNGRRVLFGSDSTDPAHIVASTLTNHGAITFDDGATTGTGGPARLVNASDGTVMLAPGTQFVSGGCCVNPDKFTSSGKVVVPAGSSTAPVLLENIGYQATGGTTSVAAGRTLHLDGGAPNALIGTTVAGGGTLAVSAPTAVSGTVTVAGSTHLALQARGSLNGTATLGGAGALAWTGGAMSGNVTAAPTGGIAVTGTDRKFVSNINGGSTPSKVTLKVRTTLAAGTAKTRNTIDVGQSTLTLASSTSAATHTEIYAGTLLNTGSLTVDPGATGEVDRTGSGPFTNRGTFTVKSGTFTIGGTYTQTAGVTNLAAGTKLDLSYVSRTIALAGGVLEGTGTIGAGVVNSAGTLRPAGSALGTLHIAGTYSQGTKGRLMLDLSASGRDLLTVAAGGTLKGTVVTHNMSGYHPRVGAKRTVLTAHPFIAGLGCMTTSGATSTGTGAGHWVTSRTSTALALVWRSGAHTRC